jgi:hypothetical protein
MKALTISVDEAVERAWSSPPTYLEDCGDLSKPATLHFKDGSSVALNVPLCPMCEIPLDVAEGRPTTCVCDGCEEEVEL